MTITKWQNLEKYEAQSKIVQQSLSTPEHSLTGLLDLMRSTQQSAVYLSGSRIDNDYCFGSEDVGVLLSVLPEDAQKAAEPGYHPGSTEVYVTFQGSLTLEWLENNQVKEKTLDKDVPHILPAGLCHRVRFDRVLQAASLIVKTNLGYKPGVVRCSACEYFPDPTLCALYQRWHAEVKSSHE